MEPAWRLTTSLTSLNSIVDYYDALSATFDDVYFAKGKFSEAPWNELSVELAEIAEEISGIQPRTVADFGCGSGHWSRLLIHHCQEIHLVDASPSMLRLAKSNFEGTAKLKNRDIMKNSDGDHIAMSRNHGEARPRHDALRMFARQKTGAERAEGDDADPLFAAERPEGEGGFTHGEVLVVLHPRERSEAFLLLRAKRDFELAERGVAGAER